MSPLSQVHVKNRLCSITMSNVIFFKKKQSSELLHPWNVHNNLFVYKWAIRNSLRLDVDNSQATPAVWATSFQPRRHAVWTGNRTSEWWEQEWLVSAQDPWASRSMGVVCIFIYACTDIYFSCCYCTSMLNRYLVSGVAGRKMLKPYGHKRVILNYVRSILVFTTQITCAYIPLSCLLLWLTVSQEYRELRNLNVEAERKIQCAKVDAHPPTHITSLLSDELVLVSFRFTEVYQLVPSSVPR